VGLVVVEGRCGSTVRGFGDFVEGVAAPASSVAASSSISSVFAGDSVLVVATVAPGTVIAIGALEDTVSVAPPDAPLRSAKAMPPPMSAARTITAIQIAGP